MNTPRYTWPSDAEFTIQGNQLEWIMNTLNENLATPEAQRVLMLLQVQHLMESVLAKGIEDGTVAQVEDPADVKSPELNTEA